MSSEGITVTGAEEYPVFESFDDYDLNENLLRGIYSYGFEKPSAIQQRGIKPILDGRDTIGQAQSGTGKTATFTIGILQRIDYNLKQTQGLILAPTRELAQQIQKVAIALGDYLNLKCHACIGDTSVRDDINKLRDGQHLVVGTPGRVFDMVGKWHLRVDDLVTFGLGEADEMLSRGFKDQIYDIFKTLPPNIQVRISKGAASMQIFVKICSGKTIALEVKPAETIQAVKEKIHKKEGIAPLLQVLSFLGKLLDSNCRLAEYGIMKDSTLLLVGRLCGGARGRGLPYKGFQTVRQAAQRQRRENATKQAESQARASTGYHAEEVHGGLSFWPADSKLMWAISCFMKVQSASGVDAPIEVQSASGADAPIEAVESKTTENVVNVEEDTAQETEDAASARDPTSPERRFDPELEDALTYSELRERLQYLQLTEIQLQEHWDNLKPAQGYQLDNFDDTPTSTTTTTTTVWHHMANESSGEEEEWFPSHMAHLTLDDATHAWYFQEEAVTTNIEVDVDGAADALAVLSVGSIKVWVFAEDEASVRQAMTKVLSWIRSKTTNEKRLREPSTTSPNKTPAKSPRTSPQTSPRSSRADGDVEGITGGIGMMALANFQEATPAEADDVARLLRESADPLPFSAGHWQGPPADAPSAAEATDCLTNDLFGDGGEDEPSPKVGAQEAAETTQDGNTQEVTEETPSDEENAQLQTQKRKQLQEERAALTMKLEKVNMKLDQMDTRHGPGRGWRKNDFSGNSKVSHWRRSQAMRTLVVETIGTHSHDITVDQFIASFTDNTSAREKLEKISGRSFNELVRIFKRSAHIIRRGDTFEAFMEYTFPAFEAAAS